MFFGVLFAPLSLISQDSGGIEEVIVSATKTEANAQDIPMVVDVLTASQIEDRILQPQEILTLHYQR